MKKLQATSAIFILSMILTGCALVDNTQYRLDSTTLSHGNSALVLFRTETCSLKCTTGFALTFTNLLTEEKIVNINGALAHSGDGYHAFWFPEGEYNVENVFFYNGFMYPSEDSYSLKVTAGETVYIGTILKSRGGLPQAIEDYGQIVGVKQYCRIDSILSKECDTFGDVYVVNEGPTALSEFRARFPSIDQSISYKFLE